MAHVGDLWFSSTTGPDGKPIKIKTARHGKGKRWLASWIGPDGRPRTKAYEKKLDAERFISAIEADKARGVYLDPSAGKTNFGAYGKKWLASQATNPSTQEQAAVAWRVSIEPAFGRREIGSIKPTDIRTWIRDLGETLGPNTIGRRLALLSMIFTAAVDDGLIAKNPCSSKTVQPPKVPTRKVVPWPIDRVRAVSAALPERYRPTATIAAGCGLRQGEVFGLAIEDIDFDEKVIHVRRQVKILYSKHVFALPKGDKERTVPLPDSVALTIKDYLKTYPARKVTLPWGDIDGPEVTTELVVTSRESKAANRNYYNDFIWKPALEEAGVIARPHPRAKLPSAREHGMHALRHFYASVLLDAGESIRNVSEYLGHSDPGFTLRVYAHFMPESRDRSRRAIDAAMGFKAQRTDNERDQG